MELQFDQLESPIGIVMIVADGRQLCAVEFEDHTERLMKPLRARFGEVELVPTRDPIGATSRLRAYFDGDLAAIEDLPADGGGTPFQKRVWAALRGIPCGTTTTYGAIAATLGTPGASRAVGLANGRNPVGIVVPCHRVIGTDGTLTGYGGGLHRKSWLLQHEGVGLPFLTG